MQKKFTALALCVAGACLATGAQAKDLTGWFVNGGAGGAHYKASYAGLSGTESDTSYQINAGWRSQFIGIEGGYVDLGGVSSSLGFGDSASVSGKGFTLGVDGHFNPADKWYISARAGLFKWIVDLRADITDTAGTPMRIAYSANGVNGYAGVGTGIDFNRHWSLGVNFDYYQIKKYGFDVDTKVYSANLEYRF
ncbi:MAG TPA: outer membrane beta-barrel protein [Rhodanobacteraceae bacterium]|nr:outer membrane beta-barrel protein [Rhodanobacteraceae bacterium]